MAEAGPRRAAIATRWKNSRNNCRLTRRVFELRDPAEIVRNLDGIDLVLNCAGPFVNTCAPLLEACLDANVHYLDITGEIDVFALCHHAHNRARSIKESSSRPASVSTSCRPTALRRCSKSVCPTRASSCSRSRPAEVRVPAPRAPASPDSQQAAACGATASSSMFRLLSRSREFERDGSQAHAMTIPWGDVYTAFVSTGIPNIETYMAVSPKTIARMRWLRDRAAAAAVRCGAEVLRSPRRRAARAGPTPSAGARPAATSGAKRATRPGARKSSR